MERGIPQEVLQVKSTCDKEDIGEKHLSREDLEAEDGCGPLMGISARVWQRSM